MKMILPNFVNETVTTNCRSKSSLNTCILPLVYVEMFNYDQKVNFVVYDVINMTFKTQHIQIRRVNQNLMHKTVDGFLNFSFT